MTGVIKKFRSVVLILGILLTLTLPKVSYAYPVFAQQAYESPREATGRIVCANCHLAQKPTEVEVPQAVLPDTVFETVVSIPYDLANKQVNAGGTSRGSLNVGAVVILPEGFKLAPKDRLSDELKAKTKGTFIQPYSKERPNILVVGPISGDKNQEIVFPVLSPDPATDKTVNFLNYPVYVGGNRGRGQVYPTGEKSNNTVQTSTAAGQISNIEKEGKNTFVTITTADGEVKQKLGNAYDLIVKVGDVVKVDQALTLDPNVGGFGQTETEIVLQNPNRVKGMIVFFLTVTIAQILLVLKKKQFEKVQAAEMNF